MVWTSLSKVSPFSDEFLLNAEIQKLHVEPLREKRVNHATSTSPLDWRSQFQHSPRRPVEGGMHLWHSNLAGLNFTSSKHVIAVAGRLRSSVRRASGLVLTAKP